MIDHYGTGLTDTPAAGLFDLPEIGGVLSDLWCPSGKREKPLDGVRF